MSWRRPYYKQAPGGSVYSVTMVSGALTTVAADGPVWSCRWTNQVLAAVIHRVVVQWATITAFAAAQAVSHGLYFARSFTAADSGGAAATLTTNNGKMQTSMSTTAMTDIRMASTGAITPGTRTLDAQPLMITTGASTGIGTVSLGADYFFGGSDDFMPVILRQNEGLVLNNLILMGATGVINLYVGMQWSEVDISYV